MAHPPPTPQQSHFTFSTGACIYHLRRLSPPGDGCNYDQWRMDLEMVFRADNAWDVVDPAVSDRQHRAFFDVSAEAAKRQRALATVYFSVGQHYQKTVVACRTLGEALRAVRAEAEGGWPWGERKEKGLKRGEGEKLERSG